MRVAREGVSAIVGAVAKMGSRLCLPGQLSITVAECDLPPVEHMRKAERASAPREGGGPSERARPRPCFWSWIRREGRRATDHS